MQNGSHYFSDRARLSQDLLIVGYFLSHFSPKSTSSCSGWGMRAEGLEYTQLVLNLELLPSKVRRIQEIVLDREIPSRFTQTPVSEFAT